MSPRSQESQEVIPSEIRYQIEDKPPLSIAIPLALQHILAAFSGIVAVPLVVGGGLAGIFNSGATTTFSQNIGVISITGVASRHIVIIAGIILMLFALFPKLGALVAIMPNSVLGGAGIIMFGMIAAAGLKIIKKEPLTRRNMLILAVSFGLGLGVVTRPDIITNLPEDLRILLSSGIVTGAIIAVILNLILPKSLEE